MAKLVVEISHSPFGHENAYSGLFAAMGWVSIGNQATVVLRGDGVHVARKGQMDPLKEINLPPTEKQVTDILGEGGRVVADRHALETRGIEEDELINGVEVLDGDAIRRLILEEGERVLTF
jgi:predicted peroxiredoxin